MAHEIKSKPVILRKRIKIYVDITLKDDVYQMGQRLISFFGQASIFENTEDIVYDLEEYLDFFSLNFLIFSEDNYFENDIFDENFCNSFNLEKINYNNLENLYENNIKNLNKNIFFLPIVILFYYSEKKTDFFVLKNFSKKYQINLHKWLLIINFLKSKEKKISFFNNFNYFNYVKNYLYNVNFLKNFRGIKFSNIVNLTTTTFLIPEELFFQSWDGLINAFSKRKFKFSFYKFFKFKFKKNVINMFKSIFSMPIFYAFNYAITKTNYLDEEFEYEYFINTITRYVSQLYISKKLLFRRLRRKRRFKKKIVRNFVGIKTTYYKIYAFVQNKKKKKR